MRLVPRSVRIAQGDTAAPQLPKEKPRPTKAAPPDDGPSSGAFTHGNYNRYYGHRRGRVHGIDMRLQLMNPKWFDQKTVLDVGCNAGVVTIGIALLHMPAAVLGIDIDARLIQDAQTYLLNRTRQLKDEKEHNDPKRIAALESVSFRVEDFVSDESEILKRNQKFDIIMCLSVSKWVHLSGGDEALKKLFKRTFDSLSPNGIFIFEPQQWKSYSRLKWKGLCSKEELKVKLEAMKLRPKDFPEFLLSAEIGFQEMTELKKPKLKSFKDRPLYIFHKSKPTAESFPPPPSLTDIWHHFPWNNKKKKTLNTDESKDHEEEEEQEDEEEEEEEEEEEASEEEQKKHKKKQKKQNKKKKRKTQAEEQDEPKERE